jgi:LDH2 family malate/lactate/ureidoglycolate dehydrogenase
LSPDEARARLAALGFDGDAVRVLFDHFSAAEAAGRTGHGFRRIEWLETWSDLRPEARPRRIVAESGYERWAGGGAVGYLVLDAVVRAQLAHPPERACLVVCDDTFPTGVLGHWARRLADAGLLALLTATSPRRLAHPSGGARLTGTNPLAIAVPSSDGRPIVSDVSMGNFTYGDVLSGRAHDDELAPVGGKHSHKAFALAVGLQLFVDGLTHGDGYGAVLLVARPAADPVPALRDLAAGVRLPGER